MVCRSFEVEFQLTLCCAGHCGSGGADVSVVVEIVVKKKLLFIVNVDWFFVSHRLPIALAALQDGYEVHLGAALTGKEYALRRAGIIGRCPARS